MAGRRKRAAAVIDAEGDGWLTPKLVDDLVDAVEKLRLPLRFAALHCGVSPQTFETALQAGASGAGGPLAVSLALRVNKARARDVSDQMKDLRRLGRDDPRATVLYLQLQSPADFGGHIRTAPDEFAAPARQKDTRARLLDNPPPRMVAELRAHGWLRIPEHASDEDKAAILAILARYETRRAAPAPAEPPALGQGETVTTEGETREEPGEGQSEAD